MPAPAAGADDETLAKLVDALVARLPGLLDEVRDLLEERWPEYGAFLLDDRDAVLQSAVAMMPGLVALAVCALTEQGPEPTVAPHEFELVGELHAREGRGLTALLGAYQVGARTAWRHIARAGRDAGVPDTVVTALGEAVFAFVGQLSDTTIRGYLRVQSEGAAARARYRERLAELLVSDRASSAQVRSAAQNAGWSLPQTAAVVLLGQDEPGADDFPLPLEPDWLPLRHLGFLGAVAPDPDAPGRRHRLEERLRGLGAVVGRAVPLPELPATTRPAVLAAGLLRDGVLASDPLFVADHLDTILVHQDPRLLQMVRRQWLAPLDDCSPALRARLEETLRAWLCHQRDVRAAAAELQVHPQTVRYRLAQLDARFGDALRDPDMVPRLMLASAWGAPRQRS